jgi:hypothetical protein
MGLNDNFRYWFSTQWDTQIDIQHSCNMLKGARCRYLGNGQWTHMNCFPNKISSYVYSDTVYNI